MIEHQTIQRPMKMPYRILIDGTKLLDPKTDGIKRYVLELLSELAVHAGNTWSIDVALSPWHIVPLKHFANRSGLFQPPQQQAVPALLSSSANSPLQACKARLEDKSGYGAASRSLDMAQLQALRLARSCLRRWLGLKKAARDFPALGRPAREYDLVHLTLPNTWNQYANRQTRFVTTVHDLSHVVCPQFQIRSNIESLRQGLDFAARVGSEYLSVSHSTAQQLEQRMHVDPTRIHVAHEGVDRQRFTAKPTSAVVQAVRDRYRLPSGQFLLSLGTLEPRKNLINTIRAFRHVARDPSAHDARLVIAGHPGWGTQKEFEQLVTSCPRIRTIGYVDEEDLPTLYAMSAGLCYVSHYEGFGLPIVEAMSCGAAVIYGDNSSMPEVAGQGGLAVDADDVSAIAAAMRALLTDRHLRERLSRQAIARARTLTWRSTAEKTLSVYEHCLASAEQPGSVTGERRFAKAA